MFNKEIRVLIADDSGVMQLLIKSILKADNEIKVVATAYNGKEAYEKTLEQKPDVVLMDILMPDYDGIYGVKRNMEEQPTPIVVLSAIGHQNIGPIVSALNHGAFDYLNKPEGNTTLLRRIDNDIIKKVRHAAQADINRLRLIPTEANHLFHTFTKQIDYDIVVIGASTGGPTALEKVLSKFPKNMPVPVVIAQHMPANFVESFSNRLDQIVTQHVMLAQPGTRIERGKVYLAPGDKNIILRKNRVSKEIVVDQSDKIFKEYNNPSINSLMQSIADIYGERSIGVILTGMGSDGAKGMKSIEAKGGFTVAQDDSSSVVFGMPKEAISIGSVKRIVKIDEMGEFLVSCLS